MINTMLCDNTARRAKVLDSQLNGIDYIEVPKDDQQNIRVYFIRPDAIPSLQTNQIRVEGGIRIRNIQVEGFTISTGNYLEVHVNQPGDFSMYTLVIENDLVDVGFASCPFSFKAGCPSDFDCSRKVAPSTIPQDTPVIDYLAKDYASFRQALLDRIPLLVPGWQERHAADLGITLVELLAYVGDQLSYYQDAVANEAYLETARQRESVRRHARLIDYTVHDGANARTFIQVRVDSSGTIPAGTPLLSRIEVPSEATISPYHVVIHQEFRAQALSRAEIVFETVETATVDAALNEISIYTWGNTSCCLPKGATACYLEGTLPLNKGDFLSFKSLDDNPDPCQVVRVIDVKVDKMMDQLQNQLLTYVVWHSADALRFPLHVSSDKENPLSIAQGNVILVDHGRTLPVEWYLVDPQNDSPESEKRNIAYRFKLKNGPLTFYTPQPPKDQAPLAVQELLHVDPRQTIAAVSLESEEGGAQWTVVPHLLDSNAFERHVVVESTNDGRALIRFGDGQYGMEPSQGADFKVTYRVGNGAAGNVGAKTLVFIVEPNLAELNKQGKKWPEIAEIENPLPAWGGIEPEPLDQVKLLAPKAFHAEQFRAVTEDDYARAAEKHPEVDRAIAAFRWTGSWHTVFVTIDPRGQVDLSADLKKSVRNHLARYKLAGYDLEIVAPIYVFLEIEIDLCVAREHFQAHVKAALLEALSNQALADGRRGFFHPDNFTFAQPVYVSQLYAAIVKVEGVASAEIKRFIRLHESDPASTTAQNINQGCIGIGSTEIARLDNDPSFPEHGILRIHPKGGK